MYRSESVDDDDFKRIKTCDSWESSDFLNLRITIGEYCCCKEHDQNILEGCGGRVIDI